MNAILKKSLSSVSLALSLCWLSLSPANSAGEIPSADDQDRLNSLIEFVGLSAQIDRSAETIATEAVAKLASCTELTREPEDTGRLIRELYQPATLARAARKQLAKKLTAQEIDELLEWIDSPLGKKIYAAESALVGSDMKRLQQLETGLLESDDWNPERKQRIYRLIRVTRVHDYVAVLNNALTAAVTMASSCKTDSGTLNGLEVAYQREKGDEKLIAGLMLKELIVPTGVALAPLDNAELHEYLLFSVTPTGRKWYAAVIDSARSMLEEPIRDLRGYIERPADAGTSSND